MIEISVIILLKEKLLSTTYTV